MLETIQYDPVKQKVIKAKAPDGTILTGYKGGEFLETGTVYAPYIPMVTSVGNASVNDYGFVIERPGEGIDRYIYDPDRDGDRAAMDDIEERGLIILDENEEEHWIDAIDPDTMKKNLEWDHPHVAPLKAYWGEEAEDALEKLYGMGPDQKTRYEELFAKKMMEREKKLKEYETRNDWCTYSGKIL